MMDMKATAEEWQRLHVQREEAHQLAREARAEIDEAYKAFAEGKGSAPTRQAIQACQRLEREAQVLGQSKDLLIHQAFG